jgi:hypothetical protein
MAKPESPVCYDEVTFTPEREKHFEIIVKSTGSVADMGYDIKIEAESGEPGEQ